MRKKSVRTERQRQCSRKSRPFGRLLRGCRLPVTHLIRLRPASRWRNGSHTFLEAVGCKLVYTSSGKRAAAGAALSSGSGTFSVVRKYFGTDGIRGRANGVITPELALKVGQAAGLMFQQRRPPPSRGDRQGHAAVRLHDRDRAGRRLHLGRHGRAPARPDADAGGRHADALDARRSRRDDLGLAQSLTTTTASSCSGRTATSSPTRSSARSRR